MEKAETGNLLGEIFESLRSSIGSASIQESCVHTHIGLMDPSLRDQRPPGQPRASLGGLNMLNEITACRMMCWRLLGYGISTDLPALNAEHR